MSPFIDQMIDLTNILDITLSPTYISMKNRQRCEYTNNKKHNKRYI